MLRLILPLMVPFGVFCIVAGCLGIACGMWLQNLSIGVAGASTILFGATYLWCAGKLREKLNKG
jgi:hypothetical protein